MRMLTLYKFTGCNYKPQKSEINYVRPKAGSVDSPRRMKQEMYSIFLKLAKDIDPLAELNADIFNDYLIKFANKAGVENIDDIEYKNFLEKSNSKAHLSALSYIEKELVWLMT